MLFKPFGIRGGDVVDPDVLGGEFQEASRVVNETTWWQWADAALTSPLVLKEGADEDDAVVAIEKTGASVLMGTDWQTEPVVIETPSNTPHEDFFQIPYNRGLIEIDDTSVSWTSKYPELIFVAFSCQYIRADLFDMFGDELHRIRTQIRLRIDGGDLPGCGPFVVPFDGEPRGTGMASRSAAPVLVGITVLPAGSHRVWAVAGQKPSEMSAEEDDLDVAKYPGLTAMMVGGKEDQHSSGVGIGSRRMMVIRFPRGGTLSP